MYAGTPPPPHPRAATSFFLLTLPQTKEQYGRELAWLNPKVVTAENRAVEIEGLVDQMNLKLSLLGSSHKKASEEVQNLKVGADVAGVVYACMRVGRVS